MSFSESSSMCGDDDQDLLGNEEEDIDFYSILNVPKNATEDDLIKAYRRRVLIFHPDRHTDEVNKREAEHIFVQLKRAYETLMDPKQRAIYDALGVAGLDTHGWQLVSRSVNPENIRKEYEFLKRLKEHELMLTRLHPQSSFVVRTSLAGLFAKDPEYRYAPQLLGMSLSQAVDCSFASNDRLGLSGKVWTNNGKGQGSVTASWKTNTALCHLENSLSVNGDALSYSMRASRNVNQRSALIIQPSLQWLPSEGKVLPAVALSQLGSSLKES